MSREFKGYALFLDVTDREKRISNQATVLANIFESNLKGTVISEKGAGLITGYFSKLPSGDKLDVEVAYKKIMKARDFMEVK